MPERASAGAPFVQLFASQDWIDAARVLDRFKQRNAFVLPLEREGRANCAVAVGPFSSEDEAEAYASRFRISEGLDARVIRFPGFAR